MQAQETGKCTPLTVLYCPHCCVLPSLLCTALTATSHRLTSAHSALIINRLLASGKIRLLASKMLRRDWIHYFALWSNLEMTHKERESENRHENRP